MRASRPRRCAASPCAAARHAAAARPPAWRRHRRRPGSAGRSRHRARPWCRRRHSRWSSAPPGCRRAAAASPSRRGPVALTAKARARCVLGLVDRGIGGAVDHRLRPEAGEGGGDLGGIGQVEFRRLQRQRPRAPRPARRGSSSVAIWPVRPMTRTRINRAFAGGQQPEPLAGILALAQRPPPPVIGQVPVDGAGDAALEALLLAPAELALDLAAVDGVALVVAGAVGDEADQLPPRPRRRAGARRARRRWSRPPPGCGAPPGRRCSRSRRPAPRSTTVTRARAWSSTYSQSRMLLPSP